MKTFSKSLLMLLILGGAAFICEAAETSSSAALPYEDWLRTIQKSLTGPVAFSVSIIGIISCGVTLIFTGGEITRFMRTIVYLVFVMTLLVGANSFMSSVFNGATIGGSKAKARTSFNSSSVYDLKINYLNESFSLHPCKDNLLKKARV